MGKLIVIEGLDGSGKATQAALLCDNLTKNGYNVKKVTFPDYDSPASGAVKMYLAGQLGKTADDVNAFAASSFYAVDRFASIKKNWLEFYEQGGIVIADRYTTSNAVHQCGKLPESQWNDFLNWLFDFEYEKLGIPTPDEVIYLDMAPKVSQKLMSKRYNGDEGKKDIHEKDLHHLENSRKAATYCTEKLGWQKVACDDGENAFTIEDIQKNVLEKALLKL
ncbi:MAG: thymidylate kinase [Oscillospiraceae bacterium]